MTRRNAQPGFTLVELIAAVTLIALISGSTIAFIQNLAAARRRAEQIIPRQQQARAALTQISTALANAQRSTRAGLLEGVDRALAGRSADSVRFFTVSRRPVRSGEPEADVHEVEFHLSEGREGLSYQLMRRTDPTRNEPPDGGGVVQRIATDIAALDVAYFDGALWHDSWPEDRSGWPVAVRVSVAVQAADPRSEPLTVSRLITWPHRAQDDGTHTDTPEQPHNQEAAP